MTLSHKQNCRLTSVYLWEIEQFSTNNLRLTLHFVDLTLCMLTNFSCVLLSAEFKNHLFRKICSGVPSECQTVWTKIRPDKVSGLIWVATSGHNYYHCSGEQNCCQNRLKIGNLSFWSKFETFDREINIEHKQIPKKYFNR